MDSYLELDSFDIRNVITESAFNVDVFLIQEASEVKKKNIIQKLWSLIKRICRVIVAKLREITHAFTSIFKTKNINDKTLDQIAEYVLDISDQEPGSKHLRFRYDDDKRITINYVANTIKKFVKEPEIAGHAKDDRTYQNAIMLVFHLIKYPDLLDPIIEMLESIRTNNGEITFEEKRMKNAIDAVWAGLTMGLGWTITLEQWTVLNDKIIRLNKAMEVVDEDTFMGITIHNKGSDTLTSSFTNMLNELVRITAFVQKGINYVGDSMRQIYDLDTKFHNQINASNFKEKLPLFVKMCIEGNIPSKYIYNAIHQISDISINSNVKDPTIKNDKPSALKGNGRFVMFPSDPSLEGKIIKVAYNGLGSRGNMNEFKVWNIVKDIPEIAQELYHIYDIGDNDYYVILTDRAVPIDNYEDTVKWNEDMKQKCINNNIGFIIRCNSGGFGKMNDRVVCIDYGNVHRL